MEKGGGSDGEGTTLERKVPFVSLPFPFGFSFSLAVLLWGRLEPPDMTAHAGKGWLEVVVV